MHGKSWPVTSGSERTASLVVTTLFKCRRDVRRAHCVCRFFDCLSSSSHHGNQGDEGPWTPDIVSEALLMSLAQVERNHQEEVVEETKDVNMGTNRFVESERG